MDRIAHICAYICTMYGVQWFYMHHDIISTSPIFHSTREVHLEHVLILIFLLKHTYCVRVNRHQLSTLHIDRIFT